MSLVKVSIDNLEGSRVILHEINMGISYEENIENVCKILGKTYVEKKYGFKVLSTNDGKIINCHISEDNFDQIKNGYSLKLAYSLNYYVKRIFGQLPGAPTEQIVEDLYNLSIDSEFIKEMVKMDKHLTLINHFTITPNLKNKELTGCLIAIVHLFQKGFLNEISIDFLQKVINVINKASDIEQTKYALSIIHKILCHRNPNFNQWKEEVIKQIPITELTPYIWNDDCKDLQYGALLLINTIVKCCKGDKRRQLIKEIDSTQNREYIHRHIILTNNVDRMMAHELYVYQTFLLSKFAEALDISISLNGNELFRREEFELTDDEVRAVSILMDFDEDAPKTKHGSIENLLELYPDIRISLKSVSSRQSEDTSSIVTRSINLRSYIDYDTSKISGLTLEALRHYKRYHSKNFYQSQIEEKVYEPGIFITSETIIRMLTKILHIGQEPDKNSVLYQPSVYNCSSKTPFLLELFSRTMWLLSKTRREMKASTINDYPMVINVLEQQVRLVLEEKPKDFRDLTEKMISTTFNTVLQYWQNEKAQAMETILATHPSVQTLKDYYVSRNRHIIFQHRINFITQKMKFPKLLEKKISGFFTAKLSENQRQLIICDLTNRNSGENQIYNVSNITHVIQGKACPQVVNNLTKDPELAFSVIIEHDYINFQAKDKKSAAYWVDALNLLTGKETYSEFYKNELNELVKMDLLLHLLELQNVHIPKKPPPVPPLPAEMKERPPIPPKPQLLL